MNTVKNDYKYDIDADTNNYLIEETIDSKQSKKLSKRKMNRNNTVHPSQLNIYSEQSMFDSNSQDKENMMNLDNIKDSTFGASLNVSKQKTCHNEVYQWMPGFYKPRVLKYNMQIVFVHWGDTHVAFITDTGHLYTMGSNRYGELGLGDVTVRSIAYNSMPWLVDELINTKIISVSWGFNHSAAITENHNVVTWGDARYGQLGHGTQETLFSPQYVSYFATNSIKIIEISCGMYHTGFISSTGDIYICGNTDITGGNVEIRKVSIPEKWCSIKLSDLVNTNFIEPNFQVYGLILTKSGFVYYLGIDQSNPNIDVVWKIKELEIYLVKQIAISSYFAVIADEGELYVWGNSVIGNFSTPQKINWIPKAVRSISLGMNISAWTDSSGMIWTWGENSQGELGVDDNQTKDKPYPVMALKSKNVTNLSWGGNFYFAIGSQIKSCGLNSTLLSKSIFSNLSIT